MQIRNARSAVEPTACPKCRHDAIEAYSYADTVDFRNLELDVENLERYRCRSCSFKWESKSQLERNQIKVKDEYARARDKLRERYGLLTATQIEAARKSLSLNQKEASVLFGGGTNAFNKYESGEVLQSFAMDRLVRLTTAVGTRAVDFLRDVNAPHKFEITSKESTNVFVFLGQSKATLKALPERQRYTVTTDLMPRVDQMVRLPGTQTKLEGCVFIKQSLSMQGESVAINPYLSMLEHSAFLEQGAPQLAYSSSKNVLQEI